MNYEHCTSLLKISVGLVPNPGKSDSKVHLGKSTTEVGLKCFVKQENSERERKMIKLNAVPEGPL